MEPFDTIAKAINDLGTRPVTDAVHGAARLFRSHPEYAAPEHLARRIRELLDAKALKILDA